MNDIKDIFLIQGPSNSGKTHICYLVYDLLKAHAKSFSFNSISSQTELDSSSVIKHIEDHYNGIERWNIADFRGRIELDNTIIVIFSAGDYIHDPNDWPITDFIANIEWAEKENADFIVCCARHNINKSGMYKYMYNNYADRINKEYRTETKGTLQDIIQQARQVAHLVDNDINCACEIKRQHEIYEKSLPSTCIKIVNVEDTEDEHPDNETSWREYWETHTGGDLDKLLYKKGNKYRCPCYKYHEKGDKIFVGMKDICGCHVHECKENGVEIKDRMYIVPMCRGCNKRKNIFSISRKLLLKIRNDK